MNDPKEKEYGIEKMWEVLPEVETELSIPTNQRITKLKREDLDQLIMQENIEENSLTNMYSISFSKSFDALPQLFYPLMTRQFFAIFMKSLKTSVCHESLGRTFQA